MLKTAYNSKLEIPMRIEPALPLKSIPMETRVEILAINGDPSGLTGVIVGVAAMHPILHTYIVLLDKPYFDKGQNENWRALAIPQSQLRILH